MTVTLDFRHRPSPLAFMARALVPSPGLRRGLPVIRARWHGHGVAPTQLASFLDLTGLDAGVALPVLTPHVFGFPLVMAVLTHPRYPLPIWNALQIRNRLTQHAAIAPDTRMDMDTTVGGHRVLDKGVEIDLVTQVRVDGQLAWESLNTFYYRGRYGVAGRPSPDAAAPEVGDREVARWRTRTGVGRRFGRFTGDYNGIHLFDWYARMFGFRNAFHHPQLVIGQCLAHLPAPAGAHQRLDTWLKGPVPYGSEVRLTAATSAGDTAFALYADGENRPAIVGRWSTGSA